MSQMIPTDRPPITWNERLEVHSQEKQLRPELPFLPFPIVEMPRVSVVIPTLNEKENLPHVLPKIPAWVYEVVVVDGNSTDGTMEMARMLWPNIHIVRQERRQFRAPQQSVPMDRRSQGITLRLVTQVGKGKGDALRGGFAAASGDIIVTLDADGSTDPAEIPAFVGTLLAGADFAKGSRFLQGGGTLDMPLYRKFGNWCFTMTVRLLFGGKYSDLCYGYNAFWTRVLPQLNLDRDGFEIETLMNVRARRAGLRVVEVPSFESKRVYGAGRLRAIPDGWRVLKTILNEWINQVFASYHDRSAHQHLKQSSEVSVTYRSREAESGNEEGLGHTSGASDVNRESGYISHHMHIH